MLLQRSAVIGGTRGGRLATLVVLALLGAPAAAAQACGTGDHRGARDARGGERRPLAIGDSVLLGALGPVAAAGLEVDARGCRTFGQGLALMRARRHARTLPAVVVLALGTNGSVRRSDVLTALRIAGRRRHLLLVTPRELGGGSGSDARVLRAVARRHPQRATVLDWVRFARHRARSGWFAPDGIHLGAPGARGIATLLRAAAHPRLRLAGSISGAREPATRPGGYR